MSPPRTFGDLTPTQAAVVLVSTGLAGGMLIWLVQSTARGSFALARLINPGAVADIADEFPENEDAFIREAWELVGTDLDYEEYGSILNFGNSHVECERCLLPVETLKNEGGNCVAKSALLTSLLRTRLPSDKVYMAVGQLRTNRIGGHAWVMVEKKDGNWYTLEATTPPRAWVKSDLVDSKYVVEALVNDRGLVCYDEEICGLVRTSNIVLSVEKGSCACELEPD